METSRIQIRVAIHLEERILEMDTLGKLSGLAIDLLENMEFNSDYSFSVTHPIIYKDPKLLQGDGDFFNAQVEPLVLSGEVELAGSSYYFVPGRAQNIHILLPTIVDKISAYFVQPHPIESNSLLTGPFTTQTLLVYLLMLLLLTLSSSLMLWTSNRSCNALNSISDAALGVISSFCLQGSSIFGTSLSLRVILVTVSVLVLTMNSMYSAFLMSSLTSSIDPIQSFPALISRGYSIYSSPSLKEFISRERSVANFIINMGSPGESLKKAMERGHIHVDHDHGTVIDFQAKALNMRGYELKQKLSKVPLPSRICSGFYISKNWTSRLREPLNRRITRLGDTGLLHRYRVNYFRNSDSTFRRRQGGFLELELVHVGKLFILWVGFSLFAVILLLIELFHTRKFLLSAMNKYICD